MIPGNPTLPPGVLASDFDDFECQEDDERDTDRWERRLERAERYFDDNQRDD